MYLLPIYLCLSSFILSLFCGRNLSGTGSVVMNILSIMWSLLCSFLIFYEVCVLHISSSVYYFPWIHVGSLDIYWSFLYDAISSTMLVVILLVSFCANVYSVEYMQYEPHKIRFFSYLSLFTFTMMMLVTSNTFLQLFFGWEGVGISSYLLINFWYTRIQANKSAILAVMANKVGDIFLLFSCLFICFIYNSVYFNTVFLLSNYSSTYLINLYENILSYSTKGYLIYYNDSLSYLLFNNNIININDYLNLNLISFTSYFICVFIIIASVCKSAQSGFHFWLAEAMEGPTPVSSLLHAATMVTAGIFLIVRCSFLFTMSMDLPIYIILIGSITSFFSAFIGATQNDLKKIVAYSTCSQLGYMFLSNGLFTYNITMFHLFNHAFFKALLFLTSGYLIHMLSNEQDLRKMGGLIKVIPLIYICLFIGSISLMGVPYFSGFFSKDLIIEAFYSIVVNNNIGISNYTIILFSQILLSLSVLFTIYYSSKILYYVFLNTFNGYMYYLKNIHFSSYFIILPLLLLSFLSITSGFFFSDMMLGQGSTFWKISMNLGTTSYDKLLPMFSNDSFISNLCFILLPYDFNKYTFYYIFIHSIYFFTINLIALHYYSIVVYFYSFGAVKLYNILYIHINNKVLFFNRLLINNVLKYFYYSSYNITYKLIDKQIFEVVGPFGIVFNIKYLMNNLNTLYTGLIFHYTGFILIFLMLFVFIF